tara:strand:+ start:1784 stop:2812 length:1029 start_codon:yes stop_codon:yes gene_type:complete
MRKIVIILIFGILFLISSCKQEKKEKGGKQLTLIEKLENLPDSIKVNNIVVKNLFKSQILAHNGTHYDSLMIIKKVYEPHKQLWDSCYAIVYGEENASKFNSPKGMIEWNKTLYPENKKFFDKRANELLEINLDSVLSKNLAKFNRLVPYKPSAIISILFTPFQGIGFGGCNSEQFSLELNYTDIDVKYMIEKGLPHELNHMVYEPFREKDPNSNTALAQTIDEGFACYFTWVFFDRLIPKYEAVENMSNQDWEWYIKHEKELFTKLKPYFYDESGDNPLLRNDKYKLFPNAPKGLNYWLGFRIIESYVSTYGKNSWKDIYEMNIQEVLHKSGYEKYINGLK